MGGARAPGPGDQAGAGVWAEPALGGGRARRLFLPGDGYGGTARDGCRTKRQITGVEIRVGEAFSGARRERGHWVLDESGTTCRFLVGADGARSPVAKLMGLDRNTRYLKGVEYAYEPLEEAELSLHCFVDPEFAPGYIGWVLPGVGVTQVGPGLPFLAFGRSSRVHPPHRLPVRLVETQGPGEAGRDHPDRRACCATSTPRASCCSATRPAWCRR